jgi:Pyruvate/2-oxoacid:ferredoxin oxidoreductase delta subunit
VDTITTGSLTDINLQSATTYYYAVAAYNDAGVSQRSATSSAATQDAPPATPSGLKVSATTANSITVQFSSVTGATGYKVYSSTNNSTFTLLTTITTTTYTNTGLAASTTRYYKVSSIKGSIESAQSTSVSGTTQATVTKKAVVVTSKCVGCNNCLVCPTGALKIVNRKAVIDAAKCDGCGKCISKCRFGALSLQ